MTRCSWRSCYSLNDQTFGSFFRIVDLYASSVSSSSLYLKVLSFFLNATLGYFWLLWTLGPKAWWFFIISTLLHVIYLFKLLIEGPTFRICYKNGQILPLSDPLWNHKFCSHFQQLMILYSKRYRLLTNLHPKQSLLLRESEHQRLSYYLFSKLNHWVTFFDMRKLIF